MNIYFSSFQKSRGGRSPPEKFEGGGGHVPPPPPGIAAYASRSCLGNENIEKNGDGHMRKWCKIINVNNKFIK